MKRTILVTLLLGLAFMLVACEEIKKESNDKNIGDYVPMVQIKGQTYQDMGYVNSAVTCDTADGEIKTSVSQEEMPMEDDQSNFGTGYEYQLAGKAHVNVNINGRWIIFKNIAISNEEIPEMVANFRGKVLEVEDSSYLVQLTYVPQSDAVSTTAKSR